MINKIYFLVFLFATLITNAQGSSQPQMADNIRAEGKIYVVIAVMATIFICVALYLFRIDKKLKKLEGEFKNNASTGSATTSSKSSVTNTSTSSLTDTSTSSVTDKNKK